MDKIAKQHYELDTIYNDPEIVKEVREVVLTLFQIASGQLPITFALLYLKEIEGFHLRPTLTEYINTICKEILTNGRESRSISDSQQVKNLYILKRNHSL